MPFFCSQLRDKKLLIGRSSGPRPKEPSPEIAINLLAATDVTQPLPGEITPLPLRPEHPLTGCSHVLLLPRREAGDQGIFVLPEVALVPPEGVTLVAQIWSQLPFSVTTGAALVQALPLNTPEGAATSAFFQIALVQQDISAQKPLREYVIKGHRLKGLLDTGADVSVIDTAQWPSAWPLEHSPSVWGVGGGKSGAAECLPSVCDLLNYGSSFRLHQTRGRSFGY